jgi:cell division protease FtsH
MEPGESASHERRPRTPVERDDRGVHVEGDPGRRPRLGFGRRFLLIVGVLLLLNYLTVSLFGPGEERVRVPYSPFFLEEVRKGNVKEISSKGETVTGEFKKEVTAPGGDESSDKFETEVPTFANEEELSELLERQGVQINAEPVEDEGNVLLTILLSFGPVLLLVGLFVYFARRASSAGGGMGPLGAFTRSRARRSEDSETRVTFDDVAGIEESEQELVEVVDFLKNPDKYLRLGGRIPRGVLLSGQPGTGKTLLARAVAGEAGVPFFSIAASEFVEAIVGVGASRVRDLFKQAKEASPAIIFIDELDSIGRARGAGVSLGGNDEREQTLNQILTEMDGFESDEAVIVVAATNRPDVLDPALLRPGRFDRRVTVPPPDKDGRKHILEVHTRSVPLADDVDLDRLASTTPGMVGADLANLANEAALLAAKRAHDRVQMADFTDALEKIVLGAPRSMLLSEHDRRRTAYHEGGHAIVGMLTPGADPVRKVSIIPRGMALGVTFSAPETDRVSYDRAFLMAKIKVALGGRVAEEIVFGEITTGAESDIQQLTEIARNMVGRWGMSDAVGPIAVLPSDGRGPLLPGASETSAETQRLVDDEVRRLVDQAHDETTRLLGENRDKLDALVEALLEHETLDEPHAYAAAGISPARSPDGSPPLRADPRPSAST